MPERSTVKSRLPLQAIAKSILNEVKNEDIDIKQVRDFEEIVGKGLKYKIEDKEVIIGNKKIINDSEITSNQEEGTILFLKVNGEIVGSIKLIDEIKPDVKTTIKKLSNLGIRTKMFTGDKKEIAQKIAKEVGIKSSKRGRGRPRKNPESVAKATKTSTKASAKKKKRKPEKS